MTRVADETTRGRAMDVDTVTKTVEIKGERFPVVDVGTGPAVVLLHGFPDSRHLWRYQVPAFVAAGFRVVAPDLRGYGDAPRPTDSAPLSTALSSLPTFLGSWMRWM